MLLRELQCRRPSLAARICAIVALTACFLPVCAMSGLIVALALVWLSVVYRGYMQADFLHFQWDALAMEMGALAAIAALATIPRSDVVQEACAALAMHCFALLGFKLMWGSCLCKLFSNCPEWNFGTAMQHHHRTTCLPKPMARRLHRWSSSFQVSKAQVLATLWVEGPFSLLALLGWPLGRAVCACLWCTLMVTIAASGNYGTLPCAAFPVRRSGFPVCLGEASGPSGYDRTDIVGLASFVYLSVYSLSLLRFGFNLLRFIQGKFLLLWLLNAYMLSLPRASQNLRCHPQPSLIRTAARSA